MDEANKAEGKIAFSAGKRRSENPYPVDSDTWVDWADGYDQARCRAEHPLSEEAAAQRVTVG